MAIFVKRPRAELDLLDLWDYIADDSFDRADEFLDRIEGKLQTLDPRAHLNRKLRFRLKPLLCRNLEPGTIHEKRAICLRPL
jgi:plasmid stabilization system protein ParE